MAWNRSGAPDEGSDVVDDIGEKIGDLRAHLTQAHPLTRAQVADLESADIAALHRRLHGRAVPPDPDLLDVHLVEMTTDPAERQVTSVDLEDVLREHDPRVWLPMRIADRLHTPGAPGHTDDSGCRACADIIDAAARSIQELDAAPRRRIAELEAEVSTVAGTLAELLDRIRPDVQPTDAGEGNARTTP